MKGTLIIGSDRMENELPDLGQHFVHCHIQVWNANTQSQKTPKEGIESLRTLQLSKAESRLGGKQMTKQ